MTSLTIALLSAQWITLLLGLIVFFNNTKRLVNKQFLILSIHLTAWAFCVLRVIEAGDEFHAQLWIRGAFFVTAFFPGSFTLLLSAIKHTDLGWLQLYAKQTRHLLLNLVAALMTLTPFFMVGVVFPADQAGLTKSVPEALYGYGYYIYVIYFVATCVLAGTHFYRVYKATTGIQRYELQFILSGFGATFLVGVFSALLLPILLGNNQTSQFGPLGIIVLDGIVAYGITTRRILGIARILQRITAYALLAIYLILVYVLVYLTTSALLTLLAITYPRLPHFIATVAVALSMAPVQGKFQSVANRLITTKMMDVAGTMKAANLVFQSVTTINALFDQFSALLMKALETDDVRFLTKSSVGYSYCFPIAVIETGENMTEQDPLVRLINTIREPASPDTLSRSRRTQLSALVEQQLRDLNCSLAVGVFSKSELTGLLILGSRAGGRIYDKTEQDTLQILCNQLAVALENAQLYTEMQDSKIRNEIMLDQLVSGVIVTDISRKIALFNGEAQRITGLSESDAIGKSIDVLPEAIRTALGSALEERTGTRNVEAVLFTDANEEGSKSIRLGTTFLFGHDEKPMGALLVFTDMTELKSLEEQVRRAGQLSSVGTLAAGMAHEIKNPLVTIKTFTQLLPKRYTDPDFRKDFSTLVAQEVARIDDKVNELLRFSKPTKPHLVPMKLKDTLEQTLKLTHEQMAQRGIVPHTNFMASRDDIHGDEKLLSQALVNLILNAIDAIGENGSITVGTVNCRYSFANGGSPGQAISKQCVRLQITDTGKGIARENLAKIFDPFFTMKAEGTGMGLAVSHGIVQDHHGAIEVESRPGMGTTFFIFIPLLEKDGAA